MNTNSTKHTEPITWDELLKSYQSSINKYGDMPTGFTCAPDFYHKLIKFIEDQEAEEILQGVMKVPRKDESNLGAIFGMNVYIDNDLKPGTWKFVYR